jgi:xanthine dehydrogenase accessory factor
VPDLLVVIRGGGDLGSGVALRLWRAGFPVVVLESERPIAVRRTVSFAEAVYAGQSWVEEARGVLAGSAAEAQDLIKTGAVPVLIDPSASSLESLRPEIVVDAIMAKRNTGTRSDMASFVVALGPGFTAGDDVRAVVETNRGPHLGRVIWQGRAEPDSGAPGPVAGITKARVLRAPATGTLRCRRSIGDIVEAGEVVAEVHGRSIVAAFTGLVRGLAQDGLEVENGMKVGDLDPRLDPRLCRLVSDKSLAVAGGVLEAVMMYLRGRNDD